jgi:hypothetical protein
MKSKGKGTDTYRELEYEMDPFIWTLIKLPIGKTKAVIVEESAEHKDWDVAEKGLKVSEQVIVRRQLLLPVLKYRIAFRKYYGNMEHI